MQKFVLATVRLISLVILTGLLVFILLSLSPIDPIKAYIGNDLLHVSPQQYQNIANQWGFDQPLWLRFLSWLGQILQGNFGYSMIYQEPVINVIRERLGPSLVLIIGAWLFSGTVGILLGFIAGRFANQWQDRVISVFAYLLASLPSFWIGLLFIFLFSVKLQWLPICCAWPIGETEDTASLWQRIHHLILPLLTLGLFGVGNIALHTRAKITEVMNSDFIYYAKAQGDKGWAMFNFHVIKHAITPAICMQFASVGELISGTLLIEQIYAYPGLGQAVIDACFKEDIPLLMAIVLCCTILVCIANKIADVLLKKINEGVNE